MGLKEDLDDYVEKGLRSNWTRRNGQKVPELNDIGLANDGVDLDAAVLYADLADSTGLVKGYKDWFAAAIYKNYLYCADKIITSMGGAITAYDGDRVMAVFIGDSKESMAVKCALKIKYAVDEILQPAIRAKYPNTNFVLQQKVGVDTSQLLVARTGIRGNNDLVWVGSAANNAAKLAALPVTFSTYITERVYTRLTRNELMGGNPARLMWTSITNTNIDLQTYGTSYRWAI